MKKESPHVLVIDDEEDFRAILDYALTAAGYRVSQAPNGGAGLKRFAELKPDIVLLDMTMPDLNGIEVCRSIRASETGKGTPIVMITVRSHLQPVTEALEAGANDYVLKPFEMEDLLDRIGRALAACGR